MGRLLNELIAESKMAEAANPAIPANLAARASRDSQDSQESQGAGTFEMRAHLLALCVDELLPRRLVDALPDRDVDACFGYGDAELRDYLQALERGRVMDAGRVPPEYTATVHCAGCGPVLLWPDCPPTVRACPWCFKRKAGKAIPRPLVRCGACDHFQPDPTTLTGACAAGRQTTWPNLPHRCIGWMPVCHPQTEMPQ